MLKDKELLIFKYISDLTGIQLENITPDSSIKSDLNLTDIEKVDLLNNISIEMRFDIPEDTDYEEIITVRDIIEFAENNSEEL
jgi:acyl carrier protein